MVENIWLWVGFNIFVLIMLAIDLGVFHRKEHEIPVREALIWSAIWIGMALAFNVMIYFWQGSEVALQFLTAYLLEKSLSVDNLFVFLVIFTYFSVPHAYQHKVLFWGILGALVMRAIFIATGVTLLHNFHWIIYVFGAMLIYTGFKMWKNSGEPEIEPEKNPVLKLFKRLMPITENFVGSRFFIKQYGRRYATPLFVVLIVVETTDVIFAVDSIPAVLAISSDPFIVYTSNVFAILGLRALYFALAGIMGMFHYLSYGLSAILIFVGIKMLVQDVYDVSIGVALGVVGTILTVSIVASLLLKPKEADDAAADSLEEHARP